MRTPRRQRAATLRQSLTARPGLAGSPMNCDAADHPASDRFDSGVGHEGDNARSGSEETMSYTFDVCESTDCGITRKHWVVSHRETGEGVANCWSEDAARIHTDSLNRGADPRFGAPQPPRDFAAEQAEFRQNMQAGSPQPPHLTAAIRAGEQSRVDLTIRVEGNTAPGSRFTVQVVNYLDSGTTTERVYENATVEAALADVLTYV